MHVCDIGREVCLRKVALAAAEAGKIEPEHGDAAFRQPAADAEHGNGVLGAGEAMAGDRKRARCTGRQLQPRIQAISVAAFKFCFQGFNVQALWCCRLQIYV